MTVTATPAPTAPTTPVPAQLGALDGIRGIGIVVVLLYHQNITWFPNGVLVISMFFTLSGYLLTRLVVAETQRSGTIDFGRFWLRRLRRLMPAALATIIAVSLASWAWPDSTRPLQFTDVVASATYWENLHLYYSGSSYEAISGIASPLLHMWSLSLEEQVFVVFPLLMFAVLVWRPRWAVPVLTAACVAGFALGPILQAHYDGNVSKPYYFTPVRAAEFFVGVLLAVVVATWPAILATVRRAAAVPVVQATMVALVVAEIALWASVGLTTSWLFPWGVVASALMTAGIMVVAETDALAARALSFAPLAWLGVRVYGIYLVHWPVFRIVDGERSGLSGFWLFWVRVAITLALSETMFRLFEDPIRRRRRWMDTRRFLAGCAVLLIGALAFGWLASRDQPGPLVDTAAISAEETALLDTPVVPAGAPTRSAVDPALPARLLLVGDSQTFTMANGLRDRATDAGIDLRSHPGVGCGIGGITPIRYLGIEKPEQEGCRVWAENRAEIVRRFRPNLVIVIGGLGDLSDRRIDDSGTWTHVGEPAYDAWLLDEMNAFVDEMTANGAHVLWLTHPDVDVPYQAGQTGTPPFDESDPERMARYIELIEQVGEQRPEVTVADFASQVRSLPGGQFDPAVRPDGTHIDFAQAPQLVDWLMQETTAVTAESVPAAPPAATGDTGQPSDDAG
jgi:peptidoglycan/LPS O-acetylase OafA/YrhL